MHNTYRNIESGCQPVFWEAGSLSSHIKVQADALIGKLCIRLAFIAGEEEKVLTGIWVREAGRNIGLQALTEELSDTPVFFQVPPTIMDYGLNIKKLQFGYAFEKEEFTINMVTNEYGTLTVSTEKQEEKRTISFILTLGLMFSFQDMPLIGQCFRNYPVCITLKELGVYIDGGGTCALSAAFVFLLGEQSIDIRLPAFGQKKVLSGGSTTERKDVSEAGDIKWIDVKKNLGAVRLSRLGFALVDGGLTVYVDAGLKLSILLFEVIGLYVLVPMKKGISMQYGIQGMTVSIQKEPFYISGGLYLTKEAEIYTGELSVQVKSLQMTALASYGKMTGSEASFFAFLLLQYPLGGAPAFYITGIAGGFGYNRTIALPADVKQVKEFPFVAAAFGMGILNQSMTPSDVLLAMNTYISPKPGQFFSAAGIRFTSFGILDSFLLLNILFGEKFEISVLGVSIMTLPPKQDKPFVFIELMLKAVIAPADGVISILGALSSQSYLLDPDCRLTGGFAAAAWFGSNEHKGDFVLTLGGYKEGFEVAHYPKVDRVGIDWMISKELKLTGSFYFALTPNCIMMGGNTALTFEKGRIKAWFCAQLEFYMRWQPFAYEFSVGVSLGASYRWDFFPFYKTFKVELSANLSCYGPPFGGKVHISWYVISFTISFGEKKQEKMALSWDEFADTFLVKQEKGVRKLINIQALGGNVGNEEKEVIYYSSDSVTLEVSSLLPCTAIADGTNSLLRESGEAIGVVPMQIAGYSSTLTASLQNSAGEPVKMKTEWICANVPKALWNTCEPEPYDSDGVKKNQLMGVRFRAPEPEYLGVLPADGSYSMTVLCERERLFLPDVEWPHLKPVEPVEYPGDVIPQVEKTIACCAERDSLLTGLSKVYQTADTVDMENWGTNLSDILLGEPLLMTMGSEKEAQEWNRKE